MGSTTTVFGEEELGLSRLPSGELLRDAIAADPAGFLGADHAAQRGPDPALLVKLLDAGERLPVHVHPDGRVRAGQARRAVRQDRGLDSRRRDCSGRDRVRRLSRGRVALRRSSAGWRAGWSVLARCAQPLPRTAGGHAVRAGGVPHAIGEGLLIVELQEPTDLSVLLEWHGFGIDDPHEASLGLGWEAALDCVDRSAHDSRGPGRSPARRPGCPPAAEGGGPVLSCGARRACAGGRARARLRRPRRAGGRRHARAPEDGGPLELRRGRNGPAPARRRGVPCERRGRVDRLPAAGACERSRCLTDLLVGIDVGTSACKAAVVDEDGRELGHGKAPTPWRQVPTGAEVDPEALFEAAVEAVGGAVAAAPEGRVLGIGVTSMAEAGVLLDGEDRVLHPAIVWHDARGAGEADGIRCRTRRGSLQRAHRSARQPAVHAGEASLALRPSPTGACRAPLAERRRVGRPPAGRGRRGRAVAVVAHGPARPGREGALRRRPGVGAVAGRPAARARARRHTGRRSRRRDVAPAAGRHPHRRRARPPLRGGRGGCCGSRRRARLLWHGGGARPCGRAAPGTGGHPPQRRRWSDRRVPRVRGPPGAARRALVRPRPAGGLDALGVGPERVPGSPQARSRPLLATLPRSRSSCIRSSARPCACPPASRPSASGGRRSTR